MVKLAPSLNHSIRSPSSVPQACEALEDDEDDPITVDELQLLSKRGHALPVHPDVDKMLTEVDHTLSVSHSWEEKAGICLQAK